MAEKSGFFNALLNEGEYDRKYNANDYCDNLAVVISNGVLRSINDDLKVTASGLVSSVAIGRAWINGHWYFNDSVYTFPAVSAPVGANRWDRVMLRFDNSLANRRISLTYVQGTAASTPTKPEPVRSGDIYDLVLADIYVAAGATNVTVTDTRSDADICGWIYSTSGDNSFFTSLDEGFNEWFEGVRDTLSSVTLFKRYSWATTLAANTNIVAFNIPQYDADTCFISVYVNGIRDSRYTQANNVLTFAGTLTAGTKVEVFCYKSIDGTGIMSVSDEITELQNEVDTLNGISKFTYKCTGLNDNIALSQIAAAIYAGSYTVGSLSSAAEAFLASMGGNAYLATLRTDSQITIDVSGKLGATTPFAGAGTADNRYKWFVLSDTGVNEKRIVFDFAHCDRIYITPAANTYNIIFFATDIHLRNCSAYVYSTAANCNVTMVTGSTMFGRMTFAYCIFKIVTTGLAIIAENGDFDSCLLHVKSSTNNAYCINASTSALVTMDQCTVSAYVASSGKVGAPLCIQSTETNAVIMAQNLNAPVIAQSGYTQTNLLVSNAGMIQIYGVISTLTSAGNAANRSVSGQIQKNKH